MSVKQSPTQTRPITRKVDGGTPKWGIAMTILVLLPKWVICTTAVMWLLFAIVDPLTRWSAGKHPAIQRTVNGIYHCFWFIDIVFNATTGSLWFLELPKGSPRWYIETFSDRLRRYYHHQRGWRYHLAALFSGPINHISGGHI
jgi:hypothetical protein